MPMDCKDATGIVSDGSYPMDIWLTGTRNTTVHWTLPLMHGPCLTTRLMWHSQTTLHMRETLSWCSWILLRWPSCTQGRTLLQCSLKCLKNLVLVIRYNCCLSRSGLIIFLPCFPFVSIYSSYIIVTFPYVITTPLRLISLYITHY